MTTFGNSAVDYTDGAGETAADYPTLNDKIEKAISVARHGLETYENPVVAWTGGKDSTLVLYVVAAVAERFDLDTPPAVFIDHYQHFDDLVAFAEHWADEWDVELVYARNEDVGRYVAEHGLEPGDDIPVDALDERNQHHVHTLLDYKEPTFAFRLDTDVGNHLLKTVALDNALEAHDVDAVFSGIRWDEQDARADETFFSPRHDPEIYPPHDRVHPILQFDEAAVWDATWQYVVPESAPAYPAGYTPRSIDDLPGDLTHDDIPVSPRYFEGYRSLGGRLDTTRAADTPAWLQDLDHTTERAGRAQDKEALMERLRDLGYM